MKKIVKSLILIAAAAMGFTACQEELQNDAPLTEETVEVKFVASSADTKTSVDTSGDTPLFSWGDNETFTVLEQTDALAAATSVTYEKVDGKANITATFAANAGKESYNYVTVYPASGYVSAESLAAVTLSLPAVQTMAEGSYDPAADLMVSEVVTTTAQPAEAQMVRFTRLAAVAKMTLKNFALESGDEVEQVIFTADGKNLAGTVTADLADPHMFTVAEGVNNVTVNTTSSSDVYFTLLPTTLEAGAAYTVTVITKEKLYIKTGTIPADKSLAFEAGMVTRFGVNMSSAAPSEKWVLVKDASTLKQGDIVTIAAKNYNYVVGKQGTNYPIASQTEVIKLGDYLYHPIATAETTVDNRIQYYTLLQRDNNRVAFDFYNGEDYEGDTSVGFVYATGVNYSPKLQSWCDLNTLFDVEINEGVATLKASEIEKSNKWWRYYHSTTASSRRFDCTSSKPTGNYQICLYKLAGAVGLIPTIDAVITVPALDKYVTISEDATAEATAISTEQVTFNYVGNWTISVEDNADWLEVTYDSADNCLKYTAEKNTTGKRDATVTITATLGDQTLEPWKFNVLQKGAAQEISIAEFVKLAKDENQPYKLTGKVVTLATNATSSGYFLEDGEGNQAQITYLDTEDGENVWGHEYLKLEIGDIVTVTTYAQGSKKGGSSSLPSIYKGHYRLSATAGIAADYTGGDVVITVETSSNGTVTAPETIEASSVEYDYAKFSYSGGNSATVTFTSENTTNYAREVEVTFTCGDASVTVVAQQGINPANKLGYELVTDASTLAVGDEVIIVAKNADKALGVSTSTITSQTNFPSASIVKSANVIYDAEETGAVVFTLADCGADGKFALQFTHKSSNYYLYIGSTALKGNTSLSSYTKLSIVIDPENGAATITNSASTPAIVTYNSTSTKFGATKVSSDNAADETNDIAIYKKQK